MTDNEKRLLEASARIEAFDKEKEPERLREAVLELEDLNLRRVHDARFRHKLRLDSLKLWLTIIRRIDSYLDSSFDPEKVPQMLVMPPQTKSGIQYPPGASPAVVDDPQAREDYEKAVKANREKQENYLLQSQLLDLNDMISPRVHAFIRNAFTTSALDNNELKGSIDTIIENSVRKESLYQSIPLPPPE